MAQRGIAVSTKEICKISSIEGHAGSRDLLLKCKIGSKGVTWGSRDPIFDFWDPPNIFGMNKARNFKFGIKMDDNEY